MSVIPDVIVIGGGVIGLSISRELKLRGVGRVRLLEKGRVGREASWAAAGILAPQVEADEDGDFFRLCYASNNIYPDYAAGLLAETGIDVELDQRGTLYAGFDECDAEEFEQRHRWQSDAGLSVEKLGRAGINVLEPNVSDRAECGLFFPDDGQVENRKLVEALTASVRSLGVEIEEGVEVNEIITGAGNVEGVETSNGHIHCGHVVIATGAWSSLIKIGDSALPVKVKPIRGEMICFEPGEVNVQHVVYSSRGYLVPRADGRLLAGATAEDVGFDSETTADGRRTLINVAEEIIPALNEHKPTDHWAGLRPYADGGLPFIGKVEGVGGLFAAVGHFRNGILLTPITARIIGDAVAGGTAASHTVKF
jgi:glycine oxidase